MTEVKIRHHVRVRQKIVRMQIAQRLRLNRPAEIKYFFFQPIGKVGGKSITYFIISGAIKNQTESAITVVLADENDGAMKERTAKFPVVQDQLSLQRLAGVRHLPVSTSVR